jgi:hypothetical protein
MRQDRKAAAVPRLPEPDTAFRRKCRMTWAALIKCVYEVDPLKCPKCGGEMRIVSFIDEDAVIEKIVTPVRKGMEYKPFGFNLLCLLPFLKHCGLWKEQTPRPPPEEMPPPEVEESVLDYGLLSLPFPNAR